MHGSVEEDLVSSETFMIDIEILTTGDMTWNLNHLVPDVH